MDYRRFGRTGVEVSVVGIGTGGASRLGLEYGSTEDEAINIIRRGLELGITYFDTAANYKTEHILGRALVGHRSEVVLSSKVRPVLSEGVFRDREGLRTEVERSLAKLQTDVIDVYHLHRVTNLSYEHCVNILVPAMLELRDEGKIRFIALSESSIDLDHSMLKRALQDDYWDVIMTSFNLFNQSARNEILPFAIRNDIAIEIMASARSQFSQPDLLVAEIDRLIGAGKLRANQINRIDPLDFLCDGERRITVAEASYRFAAHESGVHVVLVGTGNVAHLEENVAALNRGPLPTEIRERLVSVFGHLQAEVHVPGRESESDLY